MDLIKRLQLINPDKLNELCRMHLSFTLDLHDEEFSSLLSVKNEQKSKWNYFLRKNRDKSGLDPVPLTQGSILQIYQVIEFLSREPNISHEGLFRKTGNISRQNELKALLNAGATIDLSLGHYSIDDCACVVKNLLADLPEPLLTEAHFSAHCQISDMLRDEEVPEKQAKVLQRQLKSVRLLLLLLPSDNYFLLKRLLALLRQVQVASEQNRMNAHNLATIFAPQILCPRKMSAEQMKQSFPQMVKVVSFLIENTSELFEPPPELSQDVSLFLNELKSISSTEVNGKTEAVKTAVAFCERTNVDEYNSEDYTKKALTELHTYIQHLPNSARKRKLIKKLKTENGNCDADENRRKHFRSCSVGDAIKKRLWKHNRAKDGFHKDYHHASYDMLAAGPSKSVDRISPPKAKSVEALNLEKLPSCKQRYMAKNLLRASKKLKSLQF